MAPGPPILLSLLLISSVLLQAFALPLWSGAGRRAVGPAVAGGPTEKLAPSMSIPFMTLKPFIPTKPANPFIPSFVPDPNMFIDKKAELLNDLFSSPLMGAGLATKSKTSSTSPGASKWAVGAGGPFAPPPSSKRALGPYASPWAAGFMPTTTPAAPTVDPAVFMGKKADFLSALFSGMGAGKVAGPMMFPPGFWMPPPPAPPTTPAPVEDDTAMLQAGLLQLIQAFDAAPSPTPAVPPILLAPSPSPSIVPPSFWVPSNPLAPPSEYMQKVSDFLSKLFITMQNTTSAPATESVATRSVDTAVSPLASRAARHHNDHYWQPEDWDGAVQTALRSVAEASAAPPSNPAVATKDLVVNSILSEVANLKTAMMDTLSEMITKQKEMAAVAAAAAPTKRPPKFGPFAWLATPPPAPTTDPTEPYQKRLDTIGQVFDMLTSLGQEVATGTASASMVPNNATAAAPSVSGVSSRSVRSAPLGAARSVQLAVHQGYQSMPPGTEEVVSAGAGRDPESAHEGGGVNLKIKIPHGGHY